MYIYHVSIEFELCIVAGLDALTECILFIRYT